MSNDDKNDPSEESVLQKYLKQQRAQDAGAPSVPESAIVVEPPPLPPPSAPSLNDLNIPERGEAASRSNIHFRPAGFWRRVVALFIDACLLMLLMSPLTYTVPFLSSPDTSLLKMGEFMTFFRGFALYFVVNLILNLVVRFFYYGWFYKNKGATPGKLILSLRVFNVETGAYPGYGQTFLREGFMKPYVCGLITLGIGYLIVGFRQDKKGLHDLVCSTQVVVREQSA